MLEDWLTVWSEHWGYKNKLRVKLRPHTAGSDLLELSVSPMRIKERLPK